ncbi:sigma-70 family RNA polymerase sigma factor [Amycolatopsis sp. NPDC004625]|uniref:sigma-70 family RNA polymerase sigma factor n=1 Tax=Amycolatopsis sp. NPDC004625 TaxID=3154670 RepID=UPI0033AA7011
MFDTARTAFAWLVTGPHPVALDGRQISGLPPRLVPLDEVGKLTVAKGCPQQTRDAVWTALVTRSRAEGGTWTVACVGLALPVLLPVAAKLTNRFRGEFHDIHAAVLTGFLEALVDVDLDRPAILVRLRWAAYRAGHRALREALDAAAPVADLGARAPGPEHVGGHPDFVLLAAVDAGVLTAADAALIGDTRFGELSLAEAAQARGQTYKATQQARHRAERKLAEYLSDAATRPRRRRTVARAPEKSWRPVSPRPPKSGVGDRGTRVPARPRPSRSTSEPGAVQEASPCD